MVVTVKTINFLTQKYCMANSEDPDQTAPQRSSLIWVFTVCLGQSVRKTGTCFCPVILRYEGQSWYTILAYTILLRVSTVTEPYWQDKMLIMLKKKKNFSKIYCMCSPRLMKTRPFLCFSHVNF